MEQRFIQCGMAQGSTRTVGWIEERGAKLGALVAIDELGGFWEVIGVGDTVRTKTEVKDAENRARQPFTAMKSYRKVN